MEELYLYVGYAVGAIIGAVSGATAYYLTSAKEDLQKIIHEDILPNDKYSKCLESKLD